MRYLTILAIWCCSFSVFSQSTFTTTFHVDDPTTPTEFFKIVQTGDGGFLICGSHSLAQLWVYIIKIDKDGNEQWRLLREPFEGSLLMVETGLDMVEIDGEYIVLGWVASPDVNDPAMVLLHLNPKTGSILSTYELPPLRGSLCNRMIKTQDNHLAILGYDKLGLHTDPWGSWMTLLKTSPEGEIAWFRKYEATAIDSSPSRDQGGIIQDETGNFYLAGGGRIASNLGDIGRRVSLAKTDAQGDLIWLYQNDSSNQALSIAKVSSGIVATTDNLEDERKILIKTDFDGEVLWIKSLEEHMNGRPRCVATPEDEVYVISHQGSDLIIMQVDDQGEILWKKHHQLFTEEDRSSVINAIVTDDGGFAILGHAYIGEGTWYDGVFVTRLNSDGEFGDIINTQDIPLHSFDIEVYPNPTSDKMTIEKESSDGQTYQITLYDAKGVVHHQSQLRGQQKTVDMSLLPRGAYIVELRTADHQILHKTVVKE